MSVPERIIIIAVLVLLSGFFSMTESALSYCNQIKLRLMAEEGKKSAKRVLHCLDNFDKYIIVGLIGNNIVNILISVLSTVLCIDLLRDVVPAVKVDEIGSLISIIASTLIVFFFGELIPKNIGKAFPNAVARITIYPIMFLDIILTPISLIFRGLVFVVKKIFKTKDDEPLIDEEDFQHIVGTIEEQGLIEEQEMNIIQSAVDFDDTKVKQVMCARENIVALDINLNLNSDQLIDYILDNNYTRIPVFDGSIDNIIGILHTQKLLKAIMTKENYSIKKLLVEPIFVRPNVHLDTLFEEFKKKRTHIAIVQDKEDKTIGLVTMEDVLEELVGDVVDTQEGGDHHE